MNIRIFITSFLLLLSLCLLAQDNKAEPDHFQYTNALKLSPVDFGRSYFELSYEKYFGDRKNSIVISPTFMLKESTYESFTGFQMMLNYRFYLSHLKKDEQYTLGMHNIGFYGGPYAIGTTYDEDFRFGYYDDVRMEYMEGMFNKDVRAFEGGLILGVQFDISKRFVIDFFAGGGVRYSSDETNLPERFKDQYFQGDGVFDIEYTGVKPKLGLQLGFTF